MQANISRQSHIQNLLSVVIFMLIICYYIFNETPHGATSAKHFLVENTEQDKNIVLEKSLSQLRAAVLMDADAVQINGLLYEVEDNLRSFVNREKVKLAVQKVHKELFSGEKQKAIRLINELPILLLN